MTELGWERRPWKGATGFREERGRSRKQLKVAALVGLVFAYGLAQVALSTQVDLQSSRVSQLEDKLKRVDVDLSVMESRLSQGRIYGELLSAAQRNGFGLAKEYHTVKVVEAAALPLPKGLGAQLRDELRRGPRLLLPEAQAKEGQRGAGRP